MIEKNANPELADDAVTDAALDRFERRKEARARKKMLEERSLETRLRLFRFVSTGSRVYSGCSTTLTPNPVSIPRAPRLSGCLLRQGDYIEVEEGGDLRLLPQPLKGQAAIFEEVDPDSVEGREATSIERSARYLVAKEGLVRATMLRDGTAQDRDRRKDDVAQCRRALDAALRALADGEAMLESADGLVKVEETRLAQNVAELGRPAAALEAVAARMLTLPQNESEIRDWGIGEDMLRMQKIFIDRDDTERKARRDRLPAGFRDNYSVTVRAVQAVRLPFGGVTIQLKPGQTGTFQGAEVADGLVDGTLELA